MPRPARRATALTVVSLLAGAGLVGLTAAPAHADTVDVTTAEEFNTAVAAAADGDTIRLPEEGLITLDRHLDNVTADITIEGRGATIQAFDGSTEWNSFVVNGAAVTINDLTIANSASDGIVFMNSTATLSNVEVVAAQYNGIWAPGSVLTADGLTLTDNNSGLWLSSTSGTSLLEGFTVDGAPGGPGIYAEFSGSGGLTVDGATITDSYDTGIWITKSGTGGLSLTDVSISQGAGIGLNLTAAEGPQTSFENVAISETDGPGALLTMVDGASLDSTGLHIEDTGSLGIQVVFEDSGLVELADTTVSGVTGLGVLLVGSTGEFGFTGLRSVGNAGQNLLVSGNGLGGRIAQATLADSQSSQGALISGGDLDIEIADSTISGNAVMGLSGGYGDGSSLRLVNTTVSGNGAEGIGCVAGIEVSGSPDSSFELLHSTVYGNEGGTLCPQVGINGIETVISHSIIAGTAWDLAEGTEADWTIEWSIVETLEPPELPATSDEFTATADLETAVESGTNLLGAAPGLAPLADNGGPTETHLLLPTSPALDRGDPDITGEPAGDQRGEDRVSGSAIDIGAVEVQEEPAEEEQEPAEEDDESLPPTGAEAGTATGAATLLLLLGAALLGLRRLRRGAAQ